ncbi:peregrin-like isoform X3 [Lineus longissimus]|uniref:peregrin-like isoform X3 n=1 Tax=Lineus longissimus TaxID=88925 RepID=UPI00315CF2A4
MPTLGFDLSIYCDNLKATKPPYKCPVPDCGRVYKSYSGIRFHLYKFDHDNPENNSSAPSPAPSDSGKKKPGGGRRSAARLAHHRSRRSPTPPDFRSGGGPTRERTLTYAESQRLVEIDLDGRTHRLNIFEPLSVVTQDAVENEVEKLVVEEEKVEKPVPLSKPGKEPKKKEIAATPHPPHPASKLPEASYKVLMDYVKCPPAPARPSNYYRFMEKSTDELDDEIEYDMDEEDYAWLELINEKRKKENLSSVTQEIFETLMDRFEKEAFFQSQTSGQDSHSSIDEDAVCSICMDGECQNSNVILFCDMCNLAVHQECYGVPYIPEGQWLCRRCLQSPSCAVDCSLCPNKGGAFKQTDDGRWAHVVCALWIPEVGFANTVFLEPIDSVDHIPPARWKLMCYICKQRGAGACIQCHKTNCYTAFHVTCAQQAGLFMKIEPIRETNVNGVYVSVRKTAFCDVHMPADHGHGPMINNGDENEDKSIAAKVAKAKSRQKMRKARKILAEKRNAMPVVSIPMIPPHRLSKIATRISLAKKQPFVLRLQSYWTLKRQSRNGVPLLRRLQSNHMSRNKEQTKNDKQSNELKAQLKYWQRLRQDLEKARLLVELIRKREKLKREQLRLHQLTIEMQLHPFVVFLRTVIDQLQEKDTTNIFAEPVSLKEVPDYLDYIKHPMDFQTMRDKIEGHYYNQMDDFEADFNMMISNCMTYNAKDTVFYRAAVKLRDVGGAIIRASRRMAEKIGYDPDTGLHLTEPPPVTPQVPETLESIESFLPPEVRADMPLEEQLRILLDKMDIANAIKQGGRKSKLAKQIKKEIVKVRRQLALQRGHTSNDPDDRYSETDHDSSATEPLSPKSPPLKLGRVPKSPKAPKSPGVKSTGPKSPRSPGPKSPLPKMPTTPKAPSTPKAPTTPRQTTAPKLPSAPKLSELKPPPSPIKTASTATQKRKGRPGRPRVRSTKSESEPEPQTSTPVATEIKSTEGGTEVAAPSETSEKPPADTSTTSASPSPSGVNRRTSVLFSKKALKTRKPQPLQLDATPQPLRKGPGRPPKVKQPKPQIFPDGDKEEPSEKAKDDAMKSPKSPGRQSRKRAASTSIAEMSSAPPPKRSMSTTTERPEAMSVASPKRSMSVSEPLSPRSPKSPKQPRSPSPKNLQQRESFLQYRIDRSLSSSESDTSSETSNTDTSDSDSSSNASSDGSGDGDDKTPRYSRRAHKKKKKRRAASIEGAIEGQEEHADDGCELLKPASLRRTDRAVRTKTRFMPWDEDEEDLVPLEPLDLVWAKCRGYPWYPALIINPKMPKTGYFHNGVPIPVPPEDVLGLQRKFDELVYLVLFFDTKRTWQWLPRGKLEPLGVDSGLDKAKLAENKKPNIRKAVKLAYEKAIMHRCRVTGEPNPFVPSESESDTEMEFEIGGKNEKMD